MVATGASAAIIPIKGLKETPHLTNSNFWNLEDLPPRMGVIGAGPIGLEMSQAMQRFGCEVCARSINVLKRGGRGYPKSRLLDSRHICSGLRADKGVAWC